MIALNYSEFSNGLKKFLDEVEENNETLIIKQETGKGTVVMSMQEYNLMMETFHLLSSRKNTDRLSIRQMRNDK